jgi:hypothetical protein
MIETDTKTRRRSQRVLLQLEVLLQLITAGRELRQVQAFTSVVNAHGGLMEAPLKVAANQKITLVNPRTGQAVGCRVVRVGKTRSDGFSIAFEFEQQNPRFWPITFPPQDWNTNESPATTKIS